MISELITKGSYEHPKQSYNVGKKCVNQVAQVNSGKVEISEARVETETSVVVLAALMVFSDQAFTFDSFGTLGLAVVVDFLPPFSGLVTAWDPRLVPVVTAASSESLSELLLLSTRTNWTTLVNF